MNGGYNQENEKRPKGLFGAQDFYRKINEVLASKTVKAPKNKLIFKSPSALDNSLKIPLQYCVHCMFLSYVIDVTLNAA